MVRTENAYLLSFFVNSSGYIVPRFEIENTKVSKTIYPYLLGKRNIYYFYDMEKSLYGIRATLQVLQSIVGQGGDVLFIGDSPVFKYIFSRGKGFNCIKWKRGVLSKFKEVDLVFLSDIDRENLLEAHRKCFLLVGLGSPTMSKMSYPFNLNTQSTLLSYWFFNALYTTNLRSKRNKDLSARILFPTLLGKRFS